MHFKLAERGVYVDEEDLTDAPPEVLQFFLSLKDRKSNETGRQSRRWTEAGCRTQQEELSELIRSLTETIEESAGQDPSRELCDDDMDSSGTISDVPIEQLYDEAMECLSEGNSQYNESWILLPPSAATSEEAQGEHLDTSSALFSDTLNEQTHDEGMALLDFLIRDIDLQGDRKFPLTPPATPIEEPRDEDQDSSGTLFSDASTEQSHDEGMESMDSLTLLFSGINLQHDEGSGITALSPPPNRRNWTTR
ncbi:hypothetical protein J7T55_004259 [Diaporthe amygdali]|uniref:uncharacterized protein n=1 Tax=Phomopsis amygdali TaxID=1214568 RepID=UPI0022FDD4CE|nr:uncharacterized protein J7T55_004259 [Diaporthe amygdali]KAJ0100748.1 hypothetical protein J7T55_004259 [Diaporthe amygdali]